MQKESPVIVVRNYEDFEAKLLQEKMICTKEDKDLKGKLNHTTGDILYGKFENRKFALRKTNKKVDFIIKNRTSYMIIEDFFSRKPQFTLINDIYKASDILPKMLYFLNNMAIDKVMINAFSKSKIVTP